MSDKSQLVIQLSDGELSSRDIAKIVGLSDRYVRRIQRMNNCKRLSVGARYGEKNHQFVSGRRIDRDGYVLVTAPPEHKFARSRPGRKSKVIFEHRLVMEKKLGRYLLPKEVIDHIDGLTLHNAPENLRLFENNAAHLRHTTRRPRKWSLSGLRNIGTRTDRGITLIPVSTFDIRRKRGDLRLLQILRAALKLGIDSPFLSGSSRHLEKAGIDQSSRCNLELALRELLSRFDEDLAL